MRLGLLIFVAAALIAGCGGSASYMTSTSVLVGMTGTSAQPSLTLNFAQLGTPMTVTVSQPTSTNTTVFTATPSGGCNGVAAVTGSASATTALGPAGTFSVVALSTASGCTIAVSSTLSGPSATINVNTSSVQFISPTSIPISSKEHGAGS